MFDLVTLQLIWYVGFIILITGYAILDGFDLGVGILHPLVTRDDTERRLIINSIGPVWDGNEVWLVTGGGALFAAFPDVYATLLSAFYLPFIALLCGLIFRAVAIEFRSKMPMQWWRTMWDWAFCLGSLTIAFGLGCALGVFVMGMPLDAQGDYTGTLAEFFHPYLLLVGLFTVSLLAMHGGIYLLMKTEGALHDKIRDRMPTLMGFFFMTYFMATMSTLIYMPHMTEAIRERPQFFAVAILSLLAVANIPREIHYGRDGRAFISSCFTIVFLLALFAVGMFPNMVMATNDPAHTLTLFNASSSQRTLHIMLIVAAIGLPLVTCYTIAIYWIFRGKTVLNEHSY